MFPSDPPISEGAKDLIRSFCTTDRSKRLGNIEGGAARVKAHPFFNGVNWDDVYNRRHKGPILPPVRYPGDAQCFDSYPEDDGKRDAYSGDLSARYEQFFADF